MDAEDHKMAITDIIVNNPIVREKVLQRVADEFDMTPNDVERILQNDEDDHPAYDRYYEVMQAWIDNA